MLSIVIELNNTIAKKNQLSKKFSTMTMLNSISLDVENFDIHIGIDGYGSQLPCFNSPYFNLNVVIVIVLPIISNFSPNEVISKSQWC